MTAWELIMKMTGATELDTWNKPGIVRRFLVALDLHPSYGFYNRGGEVELHGLGGPRATVTTGYLEPRASAYVVLASLVAPHPTEELLAVATTLLASGAVEVVP